MANALATVANLEDYLDLDPTALGAQKLRRLQLILDGCADLLGKITERQLYPTPALVGGLDTAPPVTRSYAARGQRRVRVRDLRKTNDLVITLDGVTLTPDYSYDLGPGLEDEPATWISLNQLSPWIAVRPYYTSTLQVTGRWGFNPTPPMVLHAACTMAAKAWKKAEANYSDQMQTAEGALFAYFNQLPVEVRLAVQALKPLNVGFV